MIWAIVNGKLIQQGMRNTKIVKNTKGWRATVTLHGNHPVLNTPLRETETEMMVDLDALRRDHDPDYIT